MEKPLRFNEDEFVKYNQEKYESDLSYIRIMLLMCIFFYSLFTLLDVITVKEHIGQFLKIRFLGVNPIFIAAFIFTYHPLFNRLHQIVLIIAYLVAGIGIIIMVMIAPDNFSYYGGLFLIFAVGHFLTKVNIFFIKLTRRL